jgi:hypothetical protein
MLNLLGNDERKTFFDKKRVGALMSAMGMIVVVIRWQRLGLRLICLRAICCLWS